MNENSLLSTTKKSIKPREQMSWKAQPPPTISIITVSYNNETTIADTIQSVLEQTYPYKEHIIIDGASTDQTFEVIKQYREQLGPVVSEPDEGIYHAMNKGINLASGEIIGFINADDILAHPQVLQQVAEVLQHPEIDSCYADLVYVRAQHMDKIVRYWRSSPYEPEKFSAGWSPPHPTFYVKKKIYQQYGCFDPDYKMGNDIELMMRLLERYRISSYYVHDIWVKMRLGGVSNQSVKNIFLQNMEIYHGARKNRVPFFVPQFIFGKIQDRIRQYIER